MVDAILAYESGELDADETAARLINLGYCKLNHHHTEAV